MEGTCRFLEQNVAERANFRHFSLQMLKEREGTYCSSLFYLFTDELPYFQCFFVDEDEAQFPFYAFSPLQIWHVSLWSDIYNLVKLPIRTRSLHTLYCWNTGDAVRLQQKSLHSRRRQVMRWTVIFLFPELVELSYQIHAVSVIPFLFFSFFNIFLSNKFFCIF